MAAATMGNVSRLRFLVERGAVLEAHDTDEATALHHAAGSPGGAAAVRELVRLGADVNARNAFDSSALHRAASAPPHARWRTLAGPEAPFWYHGTASVPMTPSSARVGICKGVAQTAPLLPSLRTSVSC